ncbi:MAG: hypothetical protein Q9174_005303, partial [Haloplaca sp. 1 TL-2023]
MRLIRLFEKRRWDSSDPERAPPPLPLNPGSSSPATKPNTSSNIAAAAEAFASKARESAYVTNPPPSPSKSPEKSLIKGQYHKRMQSYQNGSNGSLRERNSYFENASLGSPERLSRTSTFNSENRSPDRSPTRTGTPNYGSRDFDRDSTPSIRSRPPPKAILGENTPPSATMLALQNTPTPKEPDTPLANITNGSRPMQNYDAISNQILSLTTIATSLQREMLNLSRRSKDNATDLVSLKEATTSRDEDIRKSLRDLNASLASNRLDLPGDGRSRSATPSIGPRFLEDKAYQSPPNMSKSFSVPRFGSPSNVGYAAAIDRDLTGTPLLNSDGLSSIALLEKVLREMATKEGQERALEALGELQDRPKVMESDPAISQKLGEILQILNDKQNSHSKLEEILRILNEKQHSQALVRQRNRTPSHQAPPLVLDFEDPQSLARISREGTPVTNETSKASSAITEDMQKMLQRMSGGIREGGGMTAEIKAIVRDLRGEVLGMGREIGRKLDQAEAAHKTEDREIAQGPNREEIAQIVQEGLDELRCHMEEILREKRRQSSASSISRSSADSQEVYTAVRNALSEIPFQQLAQQNQQSGIGREEILDAVREAWETNKPEIELQNFGLERDEILQCLKEGLQEYRPAEQSKDFEGISYDEVLEAVHEGLQHFKPPPVEAEPTITRDEILSTVRECLDSFEFPASNVGTLREPEITREDVLDAVKEGLSAQQPEIEINRDDLFEAVRAGLEGSKTPMGGVGEQVLDKMEDLIEGMRSEFKQYSAANGGDTEQVLDALKDGLEVLRTQIETYVDRAADVTGKDEIIDTVKAGLDNLRIDLEGSIANAPRDSGHTDSTELLDAMDKEFEHLRATIAQSMLKTGGNPSDNDAIIEVLREEFSGLKDGLPRGGDSSESTEAIRAMKEEFEHIRGALGTSLVQGGPTADREEMLEAIREGFENVRGDIERRNDRPESVISNTGELIDTFNDGLDGLRADIERMVNKPQEIDMSTIYEIRDTLKEGLVNVRSDIDRLLVAGMDDHRSLGKRDGEVVVAEAERGSVDNLRKDDIQNLEVMMTQLRMKVEAFDNMPSPPPPSQPAFESPEGALLKADLDGIEATLKDLHASIADVAQREPVHEQNVATKDDTEAIETLLRNTKAQMDEFLTSDPEGLAKTVHVESLETTMLETRDAFRDLKARLESDSVSKDDLGLLEELLRELRTNVEGMRDKTAPSDHGEHVRKTDIEAVETLCLEIKNHLAEDTTLAIKDDVEEINSLIKDQNSQNLKEFDHFATAFEARKTEHLGIADKIEDVKGFLDHVREKLKEQLDEGQESVDKVHETLDNITNTIVSADATAGVQELREVVVREFQRFHGTNEEAKLESEEKHEALLLRYSEHKDTVIADVASKIDLRFDELMLKYDDAQLASIEKEKAFGARETEQVDALNATKTVAEEVRSLVDTL